MKTQTKRNVVGLTIVVVIVAIVAVALLWAKSIALDREIAAWEAAGLTLDLKELLPPAPPDEENAAVVLLEVIAGVDEQVPYPDEEAAADYLRKFGDEADLAALDVGSSAISLVARKFATEATELRDLLLSETPIVWPASTYESEVMPEMPRALDAAKLLLLEAQAEVERGNLSSAMLSFEAALHLSDYIATFPSLVAVIAHLGIDQAVLRTVEETFRQRPFDMSAIRTQLCDRHYRESLVSALKAEAANVWAQREAWDALMPSLDLPLLGKVGLDEDAAHYFASMREAIERLRRPYSEQADPEWEPTDDGGGLLSSLLLPHFPGANCSVTNAEAHRLMALLAFELRDRKEEVGSYEAALAATEVPNSPTTGEPFEVEISDGDLVIRTMLIRGDEPIEWRWE